MKRLDDEMEEFIALAWHQGIFRQRDLNIFQQFAASYHVHAMRRRFVKDVEDTLETQTLYQHPERYRDIFVPDVPDTLSLMGNGQEEVDVDNIDDIDAYFENVENRRMMTGKEVLAMSDDDGWV